MRWFIVLLVFANIGAFFWRDIALNVIAGVATNKQMSDQLAIPIIALDHEQGFQARDQSDGQVGSEIPAPESSFSTQDGRSFNPEDLCWFLGVDAQPNMLSQNELSLLEALNKRFAALGIRADLGDVDVITAVRYIVYIPADTSSAVDSLSVLQQMLAKGYDAFLISSGALQGAVALGSYPSLKLAEQVLADYQEKGIAAEMRVENEYEQKPRLVMTSADHAKLSGKLWGRLRLDWPEIFKEKKYCQSVAP